MTIQTRFWNWQTQGAPPDVHNFAAQGFASPNLARIRVALVGQYGGQNLGYYPNPRDVRAGTASSTHTWGAFDWRYENPGPGRPVLLNEILPILIDNSLELGIDAVHDYVGDRIWRPPYTSGRGANGWKDQDGRGSGMGEAWAQWIHIELHPDMWFDDREFWSVVNGGAPPPQPPPVIQPPPVVTPPPGGSVVLAIDSRPLQLGANGPDVAFFQGIMNRVAGSGLTQDGGYGSKTKVAVENWQRFFGLFVDGVLGPHTQTHMIEISLAAGK